MSLPELSIKRPVTVLMVTCIVLIFGVVSLTKLPVELYPNTSFGEISIIIQVRGGIAPTDVENQVTKLVEDAVATVSNVEDMLSISKEGESTVVLSFKPGTNMDFAALDVREKFARIKNKLPRDIEKPVIAQFQQNDVPIVIISAISEVRSTEQIRKIVDDKLKEAIKRVPGVANVEVAGGRERKILVDFDQVKLASYGIPLQEASNLLGANNLNLLSGEVNRENDFYLVRMIGEFENVQEIQNMPVRRDEHGSIIRMKDVASVKDGHLDPGEYARLNVKPVVTIYVQKESTKNTISVANILLTQVDEIQKKLPRDLNLIVTSNQAEFIEKAVNNLKESLFQGITLIILVFFIFLFRLSKRNLLIILGLIVITLFSKHWFLFVLFTALIATLIIYKPFRSIIIVTISIPVSIIGTFMFMKSANLSLNVMTLFGLALGAGILVDNSIVVFENILKKREHGEEFIASAVHGSSEMYLAIIASTLTSIIVFLPLVFSGQELQKLYSGMAWTIVSSLLMSVVCAVMLVPMMCSRKAFFMGESTENPNAQKKHDRGFERFSQLERKYLFRSIRYRGWVLVGALLIFSVSFFALSRLGREYLGSTEQNKFTVFVEMPTGARLDVTDKAVKKVEAIVEKIPEIKSFNSRVEPWSAKIYVRLKPSNERKKSVDQVIDEIRSQSNNIPKAFIHFQQEEQVGTKEIVIEIFGFSYEKLRELAGAVANRLSSIKGLTDAKIRMREGRPEMDVTLDASRSGYLDITTQGAGFQIHERMRGVRAMMYHSEGREIETISRLDEKYRKTFKDLHNLVLNSQSGDPLLLAQVADFRFGIGPSEIWRKNKNRVVQVSANVGKIPLSKVALSVKEGLKSIPFPEDYFYHIGGDYPILVKTNKQMTGMMIFVLVLVYLVLASLFESFSQPILIMAAVPLALVGAVAALYMGPKTLGVGAMLGMMMLGGIVVNHSIMLLDRINYYRKHYSHIRAAIMANRDRLRPILMTVACTALGLIPMAIDRSEGANLWAPLALTVIGGIVSSTILTLMVTPSFYIIFKDIELWQKRFKIPSKLINLKYLSNKKKPSL